MQNQHSFIFISFHIQSFPIPAIRQRYYKTERKEIKITLVDNKKNKNLSINNNYWSHRNFFARTTKQSYITAKTASLGKLFKKWVVEKVKHRENW